MSLKLLFLILCCNFLQNNAERELKMVYIITGYTYYSSDLITLGTNSENEIIFGGDLRYEFLSLNTLDMPKSQKIGMFNFGMILRRTYNEILGQIYNPRQYIIRTAEFPISMISALLINAALWPPMNTRQRWNRELNWQPIPYEYETITDDLLLVGTQCPTFQEEFAKVFKQSLNETDTAYIDFVNYVQNHTEFQIKNHRDVVQLYNVLQSMVVEGKPLPRWAGMSYKNENISSFALKGYEMLSKTPVQKQLNGGTFLKKLVTDFEDVIIAKRPNTNVMSIFVGDDISITGVLANLNLKTPPIPTTQLALMFELYLNNETNFYEVTIRSQAKNLIHPITTLEISGCEQNCRLEMFKDIIADALPEDEVKLCGKDIYETVVTINETDSVSIIIDDNSSSQSLKIGHVVLLCAFITTLINLKKSFL